MYRTYDWNWQAAASEIKLALSLDPSDDDALNVSAHLAQTLGRFDEALPALHADQQRNPLGTFSNFNLGNALYLAGRYKEAEAAFRRILATVPTFIWAQPYLAKTLLAEGNVQQALTVLQPNINEGNALMYSPIILLANGRKADAEAALQRLIREQGNINALCVAQYYAYAINKDSAFQWLERAYMQRDSGLVDIIGEPLLANLKGDPRYTAFLHKMNLPE
jgi:tetratricopeptide (TPR) repeat protein